LLLFLRYLPLIRLQGGGEKLRKCKHIGMVAGGTGITPMLQIITAALKDKGDSSKARRARAEAQRRPI
jgi:hypothetical protein